MSWLNLLWAFISWSDILNIGYRKYSISREMERGGLRSLYTLSRSPESRNFVRHWRCVGWARLYSVRCLQLFSQSSDFYYAVVRYLFTEFNRRTGRGMSVGRRASSQDRTSFFFRDPSIVVFRYVSAVGLYRWDTSGLARRCVWGHLI